MLFCQFGQQIAVAIVRTVLDHPVLWVCGRCGKPYSAVALGEPSGFRDDHSVSVGAGHREQIVQHIVGVVCGVVGW